MMRDACIVFVCEYGMHRSKTAEVLFKPFFRCTRSCGIHPAADRPCSPMILQDADAVLVMEAWHRDRLPPNIRERAYVIDIPSLPYGHPALIRMLAERVPRVLVHAGIFSEREAAYCERMILERGIASRDPTMDPTR